MADNPSDPPSASVSNLKPYIIGIDTGGTFTDITVLRNDTGELLINKSATTPDDLSRGVMDCVDIIAKQMGLAPAELLAQCGLFKHGTTVGTNALITRRGSKVGFITTRGFEDTTLIMRATGRIDGLSEEEIKHMAYITKPEPLVPGSRIRGVTERIDFQGKVVAPLNEGEVESAVRYLLDDQQVEAIAVSLLFGWVNPVHEQRIKSIVDRIRGDRNLFVSMASELVPVVREYARANTVIINSLLGSTMETYLDNLNEKLVSEGFEGTFLVMQANGGIVHRSEMTPIGMLNSGPAGGVIGSKFVADALGHSNVICTDMGGTSFDVSLISDGFWHYAREPIVSRFRVIQPMIDIESIGAGGGTISKIDDATGALLVGPDSAGAEPGPICYDLGGEQPAVSDADLLLGILDPNYFLGGRANLNREKAERLMKQKIADPLGLTTIEAAAGIYDVINSKMSDLIRKQVVRAGHVPEEYVVYAFGGASPVHCAAYAAELGISQAYVFPTSAVFSAFGIASADILHTAVSSFRFFMPAEPAELNQSLSTIEERLFKEMENEGFSRDRVEFRRTFDRRYRRQCRNSTSPSPTAATRRRTSRRSWTSSSESTKRSTVRARPIVRPASS